MARPLGLISLAVLGTFLGSLEAQAGTYLTWDESVASAFPEAVEARIWKRHLSPEETAFLDKKLRRKIPEGGYHVYLAEDGEGPIGIGLLTAEVGRTQNFFFLVALDMQGRVHGIEVLRYQETHGGEIRRRRFLNQFLGRGPGEKFRLMREIENISGSTLSAQAVVRGVRKAQAVVELWFGDMSEAEISAAFRTEGKLRELPSHPPGLHRYTFPAMGTVASLVLYQVAEAKAETLRELVREEIRRVERMVSIWSEDSEIRQVQARAHLEPVTLTAELYAILERALDAGRSSEGAFDPSIAPALDRLKQGLLTEAERRKLAELVGWQKVQLDPEERTLRLTVEGMALTTDAFAKGYVVDQVAELLRRHGVRKARVGFRSTFFLLGGPHQVPLADGRVLTLTDRAVSTSGPGDRPGHIIDPRTLEPAEFDGQVVVVSPRAFDADWLSTAALVLGPQPCLDVLAHEERTFHFFSTPARPR